MTKYRLGFIGAGKLAGSVIRGLVRAGFCSPQEIVIREPNEQTQAALVNEAGIAFVNDNIELAKSAETVFVGVKPAVVLDVVREVASAIENKLVISLAAGVRLKNMETLSNARFIRALTNTPSAICRAASAISRGTRCTDDDVDLAKKIFEAVGVVVEVEEGQIDIVTALSGSGPAFVYSVIDALAAGGEKMGLAPDIALTLATQTALGAADLMGETKMSPEELIKMVVTPGGTTAAGLELMKKLGTRESLIAAVEAATKRAQEMAKENL
jgi:pyrroline-5-carboxylate reductase